MLENDITDIIYEDFTTTTEVFGVQQNVPLIEGGADIDVTNENKEDYVKAMVEFKTKTRVAGQLEAILSGFYELIPVEEICVFNIKELNLLLNGKGSIDIGEIRAGVNYTSGYTPTSQCVIYFWNAMKDFSNEQRGLVLRFITGKLKLISETY